MGMGNPYKETVLGKFATIIVARFGTSRLFPHSVRLVPGKPLLGGGCEAVLCLHPFVLHEQHI
jgi:hypothetical protein